VGNLVSFNRAKIYMSSEAIVFFKPDLKFVDWLRFCRGLALGAGSNLEMGETWQAKKSQISVSRLIDANPSD
jgi:hypothetical protein